MELNYKPVLSLKCPQNIEGIYFSVKLMN
uniref:Uncharacterized protein n=1 Tax=Anguilla anguilla TaxID=7936 RepID=A0A0E9RAY7_ANGAN